MAVPTETIWPLEPHTKAKHEILRLYLQAWFPILNRHHQKVIYVDGFCGPGRYQGGEPGSPLVVLSLAVNHLTTLSGDNIFWLIDAEQDRVNHLRAELDSVPVLPNFKVTLSHGKFDEKLKLFLDRQDSLGSEPPPTFVFIDPFGFSGVPYELVKRALERPRCEVLITFMVNSINRWLTDPDEVLRNHIVDLFGTTDCFQIKETPDRIKGLRQLYQQQLEKAAKHVRYFEMRDKTNRAVYLLFFATNHRLGHLKMKEAMWAVNPDGEFRFSDATNPSQQVLFGNYQTALLWHILHAKYAGKELLTDEIQLFVEDQTAFLEKHMKAVVREHESPTLPELERIRVKDTKADGSRRRKASFPAGVSVTFPT